MPLVHLVRHGEVDNPHDLTYGCLPGFPLSLRGRAQAATTGRFLVTHASRPFVIVSSPLERARETAEILAEELGRGERRARDVQLDGRLREAGSWREGLPRSFAPRAYLWRALDRAAHAASERPHEVASRMKAAISDVLRTVTPEEDLVVVSHQFPIWMARAAWTHGLGTASAGLAVRLVPWLFLRGRCTHASVTTLRIEDGGLADATYTEPAP